MSVLGRLLIGSSERLDLPDLLSIDSFVAADFKYLVQSMVGSNPFILKGFDVIQPQDSIGTQSISVRVADSVVWAPTEAAGSFFFGLEEGNALSLPLVPELRKNAVNFVYVSFDTADAAKDSRAFWDPDQNGGAGGEFSQDVNTQTALKISVNVSVAGFPENSIPICKVQVGPNVIENIQDARELMFRLGTGGSKPNPFNDFAFRSLPAEANSRLEPPTTMTSSLDPNPFQGGDKNIFSLKEWMDVAMTKFKELSGTTYWYQGFPATPSTKNIFLDALGSTMKSKGEWQHDSLVAGRVTWTEDVHWKSLLDPRTIIFRDNATPPINLDIPEGNVGYFQLLREEDINTTSAQLDWVNGSDNVNGVIGSFENIAQGDWVHKISDSDDRYLRVEELYALPGQAGGTTTPALAQSIKLSGNYTGSTVSEQGVYTKGEYTAADLIVTPTNSSSLQLLGDSFFWFVYRSDTTLNNTSIIQTALTLDIEDGDGQRAKCTETILAGHGLNNGDRITIAGSVGYDGTYKVEVENTTEFFIETAVVGDELAQTAFYAIITTGAVQSSDGYDEESANHNFEPDQHITVADTASAYDGAHLINVRSDTELQIPIGTVLGAVGAIGTISLPRVNVRTEFGVVKVVQGESIDIGEPDTTNILSFIGMGSLAQTKPVYNTPPGYNALDGHSNYNTNPTDDLTVRAAKITAMMADRIQDRGMEFIGTVNVTQETNAANQDISANGTIIVKKPSSPDQTIDLTVSLPANSVAVANIDRNGNSAIALTVESLGAPFLLEENKIIMFTRYADTTVYTWDGIALAPNEHYNRENPEDSGNRNIMIFNPGRPVLDAASGLITVEVLSCPEVTDVVCSSVATAGMNVATGLSFLLFSALDATDYYVWYNVTDGAAQADPGSAGTGIQVDVLLADDEIAVATKTAAAIDALGDFSSTATNATVEITNAVIGTTTSATDVDTGFVINIVAEGTDEDIDLIINGSVDTNTLDVSVINGLGTLIVPTENAVWVRVDRNNSKTYNQVLFADAPASIDTLIAGAVFVTPIADVPTDQDVFVIWVRHGDNLLEMHKAHEPDDNIYEEYIDVVAGAPANDTEILPTSTGALIILPTDSRNNNNVQSYVVGAGHLNLELNSQRLTLGVDYLEVGVVDCISNKFQLIPPTIVGDTVAVRIDSSGSVYFATINGSSATFQEVYDNGRFIAVLSGQPLTITGPVNEKLVSIIGDLEVTGVIDPTGLEFTPVSLDPLSGPGLYVDSVTTDLIFTQGNAIQVDSIKIGVGLTEITQTIADNLVSLQDGSDVTLHSHDTQYYTQALLDAGQLDIIYYTETELDAGQLDTRYYTETELDAGQLDTRYYTETELDAGVLDARYYTETELDAGALDARYYTETEADALFSGVAHNHGLAGAVVGTTDFQTLTLKDIDGGNASTGSRVTLPKDTTIDLDALVDKEATIAYDTTLGSVVVNDGTGWSEINQSTETLVSTEAELDTAIAATDLNIVIISSFNITSRKTLYNGVTVRSLSNGYQLTGVGVTATESMFDIPGGVSGVILKNLNLTTAQSDIDIVSIQDTASLNLITECLIEVPTTSNQSAVYINGQKNRVLGNDLNCNASAATPGCVFLDASSANNAITSNIIE